MTFTRKHVRALLTTTPRPGPIAIMAPRGWVPRVGLACARVRAIDSRARSGQAAFAYIKDLISEDEAGADLRRLPD